MSRSSNSIQLFLYIFIIALLVSIAPTISYGLDYKIVVTRYSNFFHDVSVNTFLFNDSILVKKNSYKRDYDLPGLYYNTEYYSELKVNFNTNEVIFYDLINDGYVVYLIEDLKKNANIFYQQLKEKSIAEFEYENMPFEAQGNRLRNQELLKNGFWKDRFNWETSPPLIRDTTFLRFECENYEFIKKGIVKKEERDTLFYRRKIVCVEDIRAVEIFDEMMGRLSDIFKKNSYFSYLMLSYRKNVDNPSYMVDTTTMDFINIENKIPLMSTFQISINERDRIGLISRPDMISFAGEHIGLNINSGEECFPKYDSVVVDEIQIFDSLEFNFPSINSNYINIDLKDYHFSWFF